MSCDSLTIRQIEIIEEIATLRATHRSLVETRAKLAKIHLEQYSMDTGQVRQFAIYQRPSQINATIDKVAREIAELQAELDVLSGTGGHATVVMPAF